MQLDLHFMDRSPEELPCSNLVLFSFQDSLEEPDELLRLDSRCDGFLHRLRNGGFWTGGLGETLLLASERAVRAERILLKGLGPVGEYSTRRLIQGAQEVGKTLERMGAREVGMRIPYGVAWAGNYIDHVEAACRQLVDRFVIGRRGEPDFRLRLAVSLDDAMVEQMSVTARLLDGYFRPRLTCTIGVGGVDEKAPLLERR